MMQPMLLVPGPDRLQCAPVYAISGDGANLEGLKN